MKVQQDLIQVPHIEHLIWHTKEVLARRAKTFARTLPPRREPLQGGGVVKCLTTVRIALTGRGIPEYRASVVTVKAWQKTKRK